MQIGMIGINHKSASLFAREEVTRYFLKRFKSNIFVHLFPSVLLSTCLRSELYFSGEDLAKIHHLLLNPLRNHLFFNEEERLYSFFGPDCFFHLASVTSGLDSIEVGESDIQRQVKEAYRDATQLRPLSSELHYLFQKSLKIGKEVRMRSCFPKSELLMLSIWEKINATYEDVSRKKILFIGASEINRKVVRFLKSKGISDFTFCNRTEEKARLWAKKEGAKVLSFGSWGHLFEYDLLFFGTKSDDCILKKEMIPSFSSTKLLFDLSFPRNIDPTISEPHLLLFSLDDLLQPEEKARELTQWKEPLFSLVKRQIDLFEKKKIHQKSIIAEFVNTL